MMTVYAVQWLDRYLKGGRHWESSQIYLVRSQKDFNTGTLEVFLFFWVFF